MRVLAAFIFVALGALYEAGDATGMAYLGEAYEKGQAQALSWYRKAAERR